MEERMTGGSARSLEGVRHDDRLGGQTGETDRAPRHRLVVLGGITLAYQGITYTTRETVIDVDPLEATVEKQKTIPLPPVLGAVTLAGGIDVVIVGRRRS
jgi:hypothetical protein